MRTAQICPTCATYVNAVCVLYDGPDVLTNININPNDSLDTALVNINAVIGQINNDIADIDGGFPPLYGEGAPEMNSSFIGQTYIDTLNQQLFFSFTTGNGELDWQGVCSCPSIDGIFDFTFDDSFN